MKLTTCGSYFGNTILTAGNKTEFYYKKENSLDFLLLKLLLSSYSQNCIRDINKFGKKMLFYFALNNIPIADTHQKLVLYMLQLSHTVTYFKYSNIAFIKLQSKQDLYTS